MLSMDETMDDEGDTVLTTVTTASKAAKGGKKGARKAPVKRTRATKSKKDAVAEDSVLQTSPEDEELAGLEETRSPAPEQTMHQPAKTRGKKTTRKITSKTEEMEESVIEIPPPTRKVSKAKKPRKQPQPNEEASLMHSEMDVDASVVPQAVGRPTRGKKRTSDGIEKLESSVLVESVAPPPKGRGAATRKMKQSEKKAEDADEEVVEESGINDEIPATEEVAPKPRKGRVVSKQQNPRVQAKDDGVSDVVDESAKHASQQSEAPQPTPVKKKAISQKAPAVAPLSPQSSDAENVPPSSRPSLTASALNEPSRVPLAATTPRSSPSKRNIISGGLSTTQPWTAADLESIFLPSPTSRGRRDEQENATLESVLQRLTSPEKQMSVEAWILHNAKGAEQKLRDECERLIGIFEREGNRALRSLEAVEAV